MKTLMMIFALLGTTLLTAQETAYWIGGTPGRETNWHVARNWSNNQVPDAFTNVIIRKVNSGHNSQPVINGEAEALSIRVSSGASLTVMPMGEMLIDGSYAYSEGINVDHGQLVNHGIIELKDTSGDLDQTLLAAKTANGQWIVNDRHVETIAIACEQ